MKSYFKKVFAAIFVLSFSFCVYAQSSGNVPITQDPENIGGDGGKSLENVPTVTLDDSVLTIDFSEATASQVIISDQSTNAVVYSDSFSSTLQIIIDLEDENIGEGNYVLRIYAFGKWWWGEFVIEEDD